MRNLWQCMSPSIVCEKFEDLNRNLIIILKKQKFFFISVFFLDLKYKFLIYFFSELLQKLYKNVA